MLRIQRDAGSKQIFEKETAAEIFTTSLNLIDRRLLVPVHCGSWLALDSRGGWVILSETVRDCSNELVLSSNMPKFTQNEWIH